jgi:CheY-like chemotaxis protein
MLDNDPNTSEMGEIRALFGPRKFRVLVADDDDSIRKIMAKVLSRMGLSVIVAQNGVEAVQIMETEPCDIILTDLDMPKMNGLEATKQIRKLENGGRRVPIIAITGNTGDCEIALKSGVDEYVSKPVLRKTLIQILKKWLLR